MEPMVGTEPKLASRCMYSAWKKCFCTASVHVATVSLATVNIRYRRHFFFGGSFFFSFKKKLFVVASFFFCGGLPRSQHFMKINTRLVQQYLDDASAGRNIDKLQIVVDRIAKSDREDGSWSAVGDVHTKAVHRVLVLFFKRDIPQHTGVDEGISERSDLIVKAYFSGTTNVLSAVSEYGLLEACQKAVECIGEKALKLFDLAHAISGMS